MPRVVRGLVALTAVAALAAGTVAVTAALGAKKPPVELVTKPLFRTPHNGVFCGLKKTNLLCWSPTSGYTIVLGPRGGLPHGKFQPEHQALPPKPRAFRILRNGKRMTSGRFHCSVKRGFVRCVNSQHGFQLGKTGSYRF